MTAQTTYTPSNQTPWSNETDNDRNTEESDYAIYMRDCGHIENRHKEMERYYTSGKFIVAAIAGFIMAMGIFPIITLIIGVAIWRGLEHQLQENDDADRIRRTMYGID